MCTYSYVYDGEPECPDLPCGKEDVVLSVCHLIHEVLPRQARDNQYDNSTRVHFCTGSLPTTVSRSVKCVKDEEQAGCQAADEGVDGCAAASAALDWECQYVGTSCDAFGEETLTLFFLQVLYSNVHSGSVLLTYHFQ
jgi:hypothetical protein